MRAVFGLVSLLITMAIIVVLFKTYSVPTIQTGQKARQESLQMAGRDANGQAVGQSITLEPEDRGGHLSDLLVKDIAADSSLKSYYGLQKGDVIVTIGPMGVRDMNDDADLAKAMVSDAYQRQQPLVVRRNGQELTLPASAAPPVPNPESATAAKSGQTTGASSTNGNPPAVATAQQPTTQPAPQPHKQRGNIYQQAYDLRDKVEGGAK